MTIKGICLNCGKEVEGELKVDGLGPHIVCPECGSSFDVTDGGKDYERI